MSGVCKSQDDFNKAFREALKYNNKENWKKTKGWVYVYLVLWVVFFVWAIMLAMQVQDPKGRTVHLVLAIIAPPVYVLAYYLGMTGKDMSQGAMSFSSHW